MDQAGLLTHLLEALERHNVPYAIGGSHATMAYGEARLTNDIDVVVDLDPARWRALSAAFPESDYYVSEDGARTALARGGTFNVIHPDSGLKIDFFVPSNDFERAEIGRAVRAPAQANRDAFFVSPEDVIVMKMRYFAEGGSDKHLRDIMGVMQSMGDRVDHGYIELWVERFDLRAVWAAVIERLNEPPARG